MMQDDYEMPRKHPEREDQINKSDLLAAAMWCIFLFRLCWISFKMILVRLEEDLEMVEDNLKWWNKIILDHPEVYPSTAMQWLFLISFSSKSWKMTLG
jgi:hypothetical protein